MTNFSFRGGSRLRGLGLLVSLLLTGSTTVWAQVPEPVEATVKKLLGAIQSNSYDDFVAPGDAAFKSGLSKQMLDGVSTQIGPRLKQGYPVGAARRLRRRRTSVAHAERGADFRRGFLLFCVAAALYCRGRGYSAD